MAITHVNLGSHGSFGLHKGALHRALGVPVGQPIPAEKKEAARHSKDPHVRRMAASAVGLSHMSHSSGPRPNKSNFGGRTLT